MVNCSTVLPSAVSSSLLRLLVIIFKVFVFILYTLIALGLPLVLMFFGKIVPLVVIKTFGVCIGYVVVIIYILGFILYLSEFIKWK